jgi:multidrug efflux pump
MLASTLVAIFFVPLFFWLLESMSEKFAGKKGAAKPGGAPGGAAAAAAHAKREEI